MDNNTIKLLKLFGNIAKKIESTDIPHSYWKKEDKLLRKLMKKNKEISSNLTISDEKLNKRFTI